MSVSTNAPARPVSGNRRSFLAAGMASVAAASVAAPAVATIFAGTATPRPARKASHSASWDRLMARMEAAKAAYYADPNYADELCDAWSDLESDLMKMPAPHGKALMWKLDQLMTDTNNGCTASYEIQYVSQTIADYRRLLVDA